MEFTKNRILSNKQLCRDYYLTETDGNGQVQMGQFYMLRSWGNIPVLSRPISVFNADQGRISFVYKVIGLGTVVFAGLKPGDPIELLGPLGNGYPDAEGKIALVGGSAGVAPLYLAARQIKAAHPKSGVDMYMGFSDKPFLTKEYEEAADQVVVNVGGFITDEIDPEKYDAIFTCGPEIMMKALYEKCQKAGAHSRLWVSLESRMACGLGACFVCSRPVGGANKKICKDGPVFPAEEVFSL
ncbi:dihydroorotate dehydrogenase [Spirochaetia bacterium]|nr:dihydroorotate dehydrogenase [Spirochaetia bacterium]